MRHMSYSFGSCLHAGEGSGASRVLRLWILPPYREGYNTATTCPAVFCRLRASNIKKSLAGLLVQLGSYVPNAHTYVSKAPDIRAIIGI
jgi:hypothetical protein